MVTSPAKERLFFLDLARTVAITFVTVFHLWRFFGSKDFKLFGFDVHHIAAGGAIGVDIFFVISGYAMMLTWEKHKAEPDRVKNFLSARFWRIYPPYLIAVLFWMAMSVTFVKRPLPWGDVIAHLTLTHTFFPQYFFGVSGVLWSLALEAHFYLLFPLIMLMQVKYRACIAIAGLVYAYLSTYYFPPIFPLRWNVLSYLPAFMLGMAIFSLRRSGFRLPTFLGAAIFLAALASMTLLPVFGIAVFPRLLLASAFSIPLLLWNPVLPRFLSAPISKVGVASYSIYLYNYIFQITPSPIIGGVLGWVLYVVLILCVGLTMWRLVERNITKFRSLPVRTVFSFRKREGKGY